MKNFTTALLLAACLIAFSSTPSTAQSDANNQISVFNTKRNFVTLNTSLGGGDYPFGALGLALYRQFFNNNTMAGVAFQYIGTTDDGSGIGGNDQAQLYTLMLDVRQKFMESEDGRFTTFLIGAAGYAMPINGNGEDSEGTYEFKNGWVINPGIGFRVNVLKNVGIMIDLTWLHHSSPRVWNPPSTKKDHKHWDLGLVRGHVFF